MSHVALSMTFSNNTFDTWYRDYYGYQDQKGLSGPQQLPGPVLQANSGLETMSMAQTLSALDQGPLVIYLCWLGPQGYRIGVRMKADFQMLGIGKRPYWETMCDQNPPGAFRSGKAERCMRSPIHGLAWGDFRSPWWGDRFRNTLR